MYYIANMFYIENFNTFWHSLFVSKKIIMKRNKTKIVSFVITTRIFRIKKTLTKNECFHIDFTQRRRKKYNAILLLFSCLKIVIVRFVFNEFLQWFYVFSKFFRKTKCRVRFNQLVITESIKCFLNRTRARNLLRWKA